MLLKQNCLVKRRVIQWNSSSTLGSRYTIRIMMAYLCSGMSHIQYERFSEFSNTGTLKSHFMAQAALTFSAVIGVVARESIQCALFDEIGSSKDKNEDGISFMTDARHQCRKNSFHTSSVAIGQHTHKVVNIRHINEPRPEKMCLRESPTSPDTNRSAQPQKLARVVKFRL